ncbi:MAG: porin family protein [Bacteroides sp.]|nr:porin family protein [Bacteroides sp.]
MKKIIVLMMAVCALAVALPSQAQIKWGVKGGLNLSKLDIENAGESSNTTGFFIGPMAEVTIPVIGLGVDGALLYSQRGKGDWKQQGVEIPVNLKYTFGLGSTLGVYLAAGPDFFFNFKDIKLAGNDIESKNTQVGLNLGAGVKLLRHLQVGVNYQIPLGDSFTVESVVNGVAGNGKTKSWQVSVAYLF